ncbi:hypothetical protein SGLAM104S_10675 [Streptomyces glaucescens]
MTVTSIIATLEEAIRPVVGPAAQLSPAVKVHSASSARNRAVCVMVR